MQLLRQISLRKKWTVCIATYISETGFKPPPKRGLQTSLEGDLYSGLARLH